MNRDRVTVNWQFTRTKARRKFGYNRNKIHGQRPSWVIITATLAG